MSPSSGATGHKKPTLIDYSTVSIKTLPDFTELELRDIAKHYGIIIPRTVRRKVDIVTHLTYAFQNNPLLLNSKLRDDPQLSEEQWHQVTQLCSMLCTHEEIAHFFRMTIDQLQKACYSEYGINFSDYYLKESASGRISLRRAQIQSALGTKAVYDPAGKRVKDEVKPNITMQIFLGKILLGQVEPKEGKTTSSGSAVTMETLQEWFKDKDPSDILVDNQAFTKVYELSIIYVSSKYKRRCRGKGKGGYLPPYFYDFDADKKHQIFLKVRLKKFDNQQNIINFMSQ